MHTLTWAGAEAQLRWGYHQAAALREWTVSRDEHGQLRLSASVVRADTFRLSQRPLVFVVHRPHGSWRWPIIELQNEGVSLTAMLGPKESHVQQNATA
jgi:hypothetical protein